MKKILDRAFQLLTSKKDQEFFYSFLPKTNKEFFDDSPGVDRDEKIKKSNAYQYMFTGSIDTKLIDEFRQGVEITRAKHFFSGNSAKIHAGEPGHVLKKNRFGIDRNFLKQNYYVELENFNPISYLNSDQFITYPLVTNDSDETENYNFNGVIEPLTIRAVAALYSIDIPFEAHSCKGMLMGGNYDITMSSDRVLTVDKKQTNYKIQPWMDLVEMVGTVKKIPTLPYFNDDKSYLDPFNDLSNKVQLSKNLPIDMKNAVSSLAGSTENYISEDDISATCGWTYDDVTIKGTDSIAFGGFGY